ncbi:chemotaxis protein CheB [Candidatus Venteria ishoeyi]|uniref:chemotaxis protein CheB n=1 Tax=Candidatus Venteria ishoeyi TaxID=1899563 RepID=UPI0025A56301|nr:chemotaxis protein CheB [Candidatus Venteria ishoeyi]MDM8546056.1 chemotaxis protein CheB [Candidatus Venteria ishoeyi]
MSQRENQFQAVVIGASAGGIHALQQVLMPLPADFPLPIIVVQHLHPDAGAYLPQLLDNKCQLKVKQADEKEFVQAGWVYLAPPAYHLLIEEDHSLSLSLEAPVSYSRPSVDVLFESAIFAYGKRLIGIILTGANSDGALGIKKIKQAGGYVIVQAPETAEADAMPKAAIAAVAGNQAVDKILALDQIGQYLLQWVNRNFLGIRMK